MTTNKWYSHDSNTTQKLSEFEMLIAVGFNTNIFFQSFPLRSFLL